MRWRRRRIVYHPVHVAAPIGHLLLRRIRRHDSTGAHGRRIGLSDIVDGVVGAIEIDVLRVNCGRKKNAKKRNQQTNSHAISSN